jgi:hypothetical protein
MEFVARFLGRTLAYTYDVTESGPDRLVMRVAEGPFPMETTYTWAPVAAPPGIHERDDQLALTR